MPKNRYYIARNDSGQVSAFRMAQHVKPQGPIQRLWNRVKSIFNWTDPKKTSEQGSAGASSPSTYEASLWSQRYDRQQIIQDCRQAYTDDFRIRRSVQKFCREAVRAGVEIKISEDVAPRLAARAQALAHETEDLINIRVDSWAQMLFVEGDLFVQGITDVKGTQLLNLKRMPAASMERLSDDTDEIINPVRAFEQIDTVTMESVAQFPLALMHQERWDHIDGDRYGNSGLIAIRRKYREVLLIEEHQLTRRMARSSQKIIWNIGSDDSPGQPADIENFKNVNGFTEGRRDPWQPMELTRDFFGNGLVSADVIEGDPKVHEIDDIKYFQDQLAAGLPTPKAVYGLDCESVNRDVLEDQRAEWNKETRTLSDAMERVVRWAFDLSLMLSGILPESVPYAVLFSDSTVEKPAEIVDRTLEMHKAGVLSTRSTLTKLKEFSGIEDVEAEMQAIKDDRQQEIDTQMLIATAGKETIAETKSLNGQAPSGKPSPNGKAPATKN